MKAQRLRITEKGWENFTDTLGGVAFTNGLSDDVVAPAVANQLGSFMRVEAVDDGAQVGMGAVLKNTHKNSAKVVKSLASQSPEDSTPVTKTTETDGLKERYTREELEAIADAHGILGLREIATKYGVKGRGIVELITEIIKAQG